MALPLHFIGRQFDPRRIATLGAWWDASDSASVTTVSGAVSEWADRSGNGITAQQNTAANRPTLTTIDSRPALQFTSAHSHQLLHSLGNSTNWTIIAVVRPTILTNAFQGIFATGTSSAGSMLLVQAGIGNRWGTYTSSGFGRAATTSLSTNTNYILTLVDDGSSGGAFFQNGNADGTFVGDADAQPVQHIGGLVSQSFDGFMYEILAFKSSLSAAARLSVERNLGRKWGIATA